MSGTLLVRSSPEASHLLQEIWPPPSSPPPVNWTMVLLVFCTGIKVSPVVSNGKPQGPRGCRVLKPYLVSCSGSTADRESGTCQVFCLDPPEGSVF